MVKKGINEKHHTIFPLGSESIIAVRYCYFRANLMA